MDSRPTVVMDFDDLCDDHDPLDLLLTLKENDATFKVTLFAIPARCSSALLQRYHPHRSWIDLAVHGWWHTTGETLSWTPEEAVAKMKFAAERGIDAGGFKAPKWIISQPCYDAARDLGWYVADHKRNRFRPQQPGERIYITDLRLRYSSERRLHGHTHNVTGNGIEEAFPLFMLPRDKFDYKFIREVV